MTSENGGGFKYLWVGELAKWPSFARAVWVGRSTGRACPLRAAVGAPCSLGTCRYWRVPEVARADARGGDKPRARKFGPFLSFSVSPNLILRGKRGKWAFRWPTSVVAAGIVRFTCFAESGRREPPPGARASRRYRPSQNWFSQFCPKVFRPGAYFTVGAGARFFDAGDCP